MTFAQITVGERVVARRLQHVPRDALGRAQFEADMHQHVPHQHGHGVNTLLFPRAVEAEARRNGA